MNKKKLLPSLIVLISFLVLIRPYFQSGVPYTHDGMNHLARFANYKIAVREGQLPPRWAPNLLNRFGYPVFNFNYPLANILSLPFSVLGVEYELTFKLLMTGFVLLGAVGLGKWLKLHNYNSNWGRALAISSFFLSPFVVNLIYARGNIGEMMAIALLIWLFFILDEIKLNKLDWRQWKTKLLPVIFLTTFFLSHNITVLFGSFILTLYVLLKKFNLKQWLLTLKIFCLSFGLSLWFWLPALLEKKYTVLDNAELSFEYLKHFPTLNQLLSAPLQFGFSYTTPVDSLSLAVGLPTLFLLIIIWPLLIARVIKKKSIKKFKLIIVGLFWLVFVCQLPFTARLWQTTPLANYIQFPWRLSLFLTIFAAMLIGVVANLKITLVNLLLGAVMLIQLISVKNFKPADFINQTNLEYDLFPGSSSTLAENRTKAFVFEYFEVSNWQPKPTIIKGQGYLTISKWNGSKRSYFVKAETEITIVEATMNFPGWTTWANGQKLRYIDSQDIGGRIAYKLSPGEYEVKTKFTQRTWSRMIGNGISLLTLIILIKILINPKHEKKNHYL